jgi:hypothetical protein
MTKQLALEFRDDLAASRAAAGRAAVATGRKELSAIPRRTPSRARAAAATARLRAPAASGPVSPVQYLRLDEHTRAIGLRGIEQARRVLAGIGGTAA